MTTQALVGLGLGIAISRQYLLSQRLVATNNKLENELASKKQLACQLVTVEEQIRKSVARELHDEIGQNITAIQIQSMLAGRLAKDEKEQHIAETINQLAMRIHLSTRQLLTQLRPQVLDELGLKNAIHQLVHEMSFSDRYIECQFNIDPYTDKLDEITSVTVYRIVQELLNNVSKHADASKLQLTIFSESMLHLELYDNGLGLPRGWKSKGQGLLGIEERIHALGGELTIDSASENTPKGTRIIVNLPTKTFKKQLI